MKITFLSFLTILTAVAACARAGETFTFKPGAGVEDYLEELKPTKVVSVQEVDGTGVLSFQSDAGGTLAFFTPPGKRISAKEEEFEMTFRMEGSVNFGVMFRGDEFGAPAYMAFLTLSEKDALRLTFIKSTVAHRQNPSQDSLGLETTKDFVPGAWYILRVRLQDTGSERVKLTGEVLDASTKGTILEVFAEDSAGVISGPGGIAFRFFANPSRNGGKVEIRNLTVSH